MADAGLIHCNGVRFTKRGKLVAMPTGYENKKAESALSGVCRPRGPSFRRPFERISDPRIPLTRHISDRIFRARLI